MSAVLTEVGSDYDVFLQAREVVNRHRNAFATKEPSSAVVNFANRLVDVESPMLSISFWRKPPASGTTEDLQSLHRALEVGNPHVKSVIVDAGTQKDTLGESILDGLTVDPFDYPHKEITEEDTLEIRNAHTRMANCPDKGLKQEVITAIQISGYGGQNRAVIILDNVDQLPPEKQQELIEFMKAFNRGESPRFVLGKVPEDFVRSSDREFNRRINWQDSRTVVGPWSHEEIIKYLKENGSAVLVNGVDNNTLNRYSAGNPVITQAIADLNIAPTDFVNGQLSEEAKRKLGEVVGAVRTVMLHELDPQDRRIYELTQHLRFYDTDMLVRFLKELKNNKVEIPLPVDDEHLEDTKHRITNSMIRFPRIQQGAIGTHKSYLTDANTRRIMTLNGELAEPKASAAVHRAAIGLFDSLLEIEKEGSKVPEKVATFFAEKFYHGIQAGICEGMTGEQMSSFINLMVDGTYDELINLYGTESSSADAMDMFVKIISEDSDLSSQIPEKNWEFRWVATC